MAIKGVPMGRTHSARPLWTIAWREHKALFTSLQGLGVWAVFALTYALAVHHAYSFSVLAQFATLARALSAMNALDLFLVPFAGLLLGYGALAGEMELGTVQFLASKPIPRRTVVLGKFLGRALYLGTVWLTVTVVAMIWVGRIIGSLRTGAGVASDPIAVLGGWEAAVLYPLSLFVLSLSFLAIGLLVSAWTSRTGAALSLCIAVYALMGIAWNALFPVGTPPAPGMLLVKLASPFVAWLEWSNELLGRPAPWVQFYADRGGRPFFGQPVFYISVIGAWILGCLGLASWGFGRRDLA